MKRILLLCILTFTSYLAYSNANVAQKEWRWRKDNGSEATAAWRAGQDEAVSQSVCHADEVIRLRMAFQVNPDPSTTNPSSKTVGYQISYSRSPSGPWTLINTNSANAFVQAGSAHVSDETLTTKQLVHSATGEYASGQFIDMSHASNIVFSTKSGVSTVTEHEWAIKVTDKAEAGVYYFSLQALNIYPTTFPSITVNAPAISGNAIVKNISCNGKSDGSIDLSPSGGTEPYSFLWEDGITTEDRKDLGPGTYKVTIKDATGCSKVVEATIAEPSKITASITSVTNVSCHGATNGAATVTASGGTGQLSYSWAPRGGTSATATGLSAGMYTVTITDENGCTDEEFVTISEPSAIVVTPNQTEVSTFGGSDGTASVSVSGGTGGYSYEWTPGTPTGDGTSSVSGLTAGEWSVLITDDNGCIKEEKFTITQPVNSKVVSIKRSFAPRVKSGLVDFKVTFENEVSGVDASDFLVFTTGAVSDAEITNLTGSGKNYTVTVNTGTGEGSVRLDFTGVSGVSPEAISTYKSGEEYTIDNTAPILVTVGIVSNNEDNKLAKVGDKVTLSFTGNEEIQPTAVNIAGENATIMNLLGAWTARVTLVSTTTEGSVPFTIEFKDKAGNPGVAVTSTTDLSFVHFDKSAPVISNVKIASDNEYPSVAKAGNKVTLTFNINETAEAKVKIAGNTVSADRIPDSDEYTASYQLKSDDEGGFIQFEIVASDKVGNTSDPVSFTSDNSTVDYDKKAPEVQMISGAKPERSTTNAKEVSFRVEFDEAVTGVDKEDFELNLSAELTAEILSVTPVSLPSAVTTPFTTAFEVVVGNIKGNGSLSVSLKKTGNGIVDYVGNENISGYNNGDYYLIDQTLPQVESITRAENREQLTNAKSVTYRVTFSESVSGVDVNDFTLTKTGNADGTISSVSPGMQYGFATLGKLKEPNVYDVEVIDVKGDGDLRLDLNAANTAVSDEAGNLIADGGFVNGEVYTIDQTGPEVESITRSMPTVEKTKVGAVIYRVKFSEKVTGLNTQAFQLGKTGTVDGVITSVHAINAGTNSSIAVFSTYVPTIIPTPTDPTPTPTDPTPVPSIPAASEYEVTVEQITGDGELKLSYVANSQVVDYLQNASTKNFNGGEAYIIDQTGPAVVSVSVPANKTYKAGEELSFTVNFDEELTVIGSDSKLNIQIGLNSRSAAYKSKTATSISYAYTVQAEELDVDGVQVQGLVRESSKITDALGNNANISLNNIASPSLVRVDAVKPVVTPLQVLQVDENSATGTRIGVVSASDAGNVSTLQAYTIVNQNDFDNDGVQAVSINAQTGVLSVNDRDDFNYENKATFNVIVTVSDGLNTSTQETVKVNVKDLPEAPTSVSLATSTVYENSAIATLAGTLSSTSDDPGATFSYQLVPGTGSTDNGKFTIVGNQIKTNEILNFEEKASYSVRVKSTTQYGFGLEKEFVISITDVNEQPTLSNIANSAICYTEAQQTVALSGITAGPETWQGTVVSVSTSNNRMFKTIAVTQAVNSTAVLNYTLNQGATGSAVINIQVTDNGGTENGGVNTILKSFVLNVNPLPVIAISSDKGLSLSKGEVAMLTAEVTGGNTGLTYSWSDANGIVSVAKNLATLNVRPSETTTYTVTVTNANGCVSTQSITIEVLADFKVVDGTNIVTPNGDGVNDNFVIRNIDMYPNNVVKIFDRAGRLLYSKTNYSNEFNGTFQGSPLAEDTYYYIVDFGPGAEKIKGFITIVRD
ncbi:gliding motility-associated C-terminal domain-containing protein [Pedobacter sp. SYSU D00535]|uniref:T9SS type B sorting domain-containing protein n=1 Tax=Pedobacter sp. SYSU D00535 TaxID=2810308 RepID=UPI001A97D2B8|nr:gliding motility-associated C-terminal domain-containing protein [Pedobacter sp. SYSU D00535]